MSMTTDSAKYFEKVAGEWDEIRAGYFGEPLRQSAIAHAYLRPEMVVADVGAGTGFISTGLAPLVHQVYVVDGSEAMLVEARRNLAQFSNIIFQHADGAAIPLPDASLDAVFANMYLHHCSEPAAAIGEMVRLLRPGGRLVITDMDAHPYAWLKDELADVWQGFERSDIRKWLEQTGLVNIIVDCSGECCSPESANAGQCDDEKKAAPISIFVAVGTRPIQGIQPAIQAHYGAHAEGKISGCDCQPSSSTSACCSSDAPSGVIPMDMIDIGPGYSAEQLAQAPAEAAQIALGCGNPTALAAMQPGETVLDIGSGGGMDAMLAARKVGSEGKVIGVDMTPQMLTRARQAAERAGFSQVEFRQGKAEALPVENDSIDVVISNCVINLCTDKGKVFREAYRVLKTGGRLEVSDMVTDRAFPVDLRQEPANWSECVFGALPEREYLDLVTQAGFSKIATRRSAAVTAPGDVQVYSLEVSAYKA
jgi:arsenite methyltransferase